MLIIWNWILLQNAYLMALCQIQVEFLIVNNFLKKVASFVLAYDDMNCEWINSHFSFDKSSKLTSVLNESYLNWKYCVYMSFWWVVWS